MSGIFWLASYPKSGNTWVRALLTNYLSRDDRPASIDELAGGWTASLRETLSEHTGIEAADLTQEQIDFYRPAMHERLAAASSEPLFLKIHDAHTFTADGRPIFSRSATAGVIYLVRNPLDVAVSYAHHRQTSLDDTIALMARHDAMLDGTDTPGNQLPQRLLTWSGHVRSWIDADGVDVHVVRYEDLVCQPQAAFGAIVRFAGLGVDQCRLNTAVELSSFDRLRSQEAAHGFVERPPTAVSFFRAGRAGAWREQLADVQVRRLIDDHRDVMRRYGYLGPTDEILY